MSYNGLEAMQTVSLEIAQSSLPDLLEKVAGGEQITITQNGQPKAILLSVPQADRPRPQRGCLKGKIWMAPNFDAPLEEFKDYVG